MSNLWVDIGALVLDGVPMDSIRGRRLAELTEIALARLLEQRGTSTRLQGSGTASSQESSNAKPASMKLPAGANEARWAEELALILYRAVDRSL